MADETTKEINQQVHDFLVRGANLSKEGDTFFSKLQSYANDAVDLERLPGMSNVMVQEDCVQRFKNMDISDLFVAISAVKEIGDLLNTNNGQVRKAFKSVAEFGV